MKFIYLLITALLFVSLSSCSTEKVNKIKLDGAKMLGDGMTSYLMSEFRTLPSDMNCEAEAIETGNEVKEWAEEKMGAKTKMAALSVGGEIAKIACGMVADVFIPQLLERGISGKPCFKKKFGEYASEYIGNGLCNSIKF